jgi:hypothetical protein
MHQDALSSWILWTLNFCLPTGLTLCLVVFLRYQTLDGTLIMELDPFDAITLLLEPALALFSSQGFPSLYHYPSQLPSSSCTFQEPGRKSLPPSSLSTLWYSLPMLCRWFHSPNKAEDIAPFTDAPWFPIPYQTASAHLWAIARVYLFFWNFPFRSQIQIIVPFPGPLQTLPLLWPLPLTPLAHHSGSLRQTLPSSYGTHWLPMYISYHFKL